MASKVPSASANKNAEHVSVACQTDPSLAPPECVLSSPASKSTSTEQCSQAKRSVGSSTSRLSKVVRREGVSESFEVVKTISKTSNLVDETGEDKLCVTIQNFSSMDETLCSTSKRIRGVNWRIMVMPKQHVVQKKQQKCMGFFLQCVPDRTYSDQWSCQADAEMRLISQKPGVANFVRKTTHTYSPKENDWGYSCFMTWADILDENQGYIKNDKVILEIIVRADYPKKMMTREEFCRAIDQWYNLANMQMQRGLVDLALEANSQALKFCKDKDEEMKLKLEAQKEVLVNRKLLDSINRIESNTDRKPPETLKPTSLKQALTGVQKSMNRKNGRRASRTMQSSKSRKGSLVRSDKDAVNQPAFEVSKTNYLQKPTIKKQMRSTCGPNCKHFRADDDGDDNDSQESVNGEETDRDSYESAGSECGDNDVIPYEQCVRGSTTSLDRPFFIPVTENSCQTEDFETEATAPKRERRPAGSGGAPCSVADPYSDPKSPADKEIELDNDLEYRLLRFTGLVDRGISEADKRKYQRMIKDFLARSGKYDYADCQSFLKLAQNEVESPESPPLSEQGDPDTPSVDPIHDDHITACLLAGLCTVQTRRTLKLAISFLRSACEGVVEEHRASGDSERKQDRKIATAVRRHQNGCATGEADATQDSTETSDTITPNPSIVDNTSSTSSCEGEPYRPHSPEYSSYAMNERYGPPLPTYSTDTMVMFGGVVPNFEQIDICNCEEKLGPDAMFLARRAMGVARLNILNATMMNRCNQSEADSVSCSEDEQELQVPQIEGDQARERTNKIAMIHKFIEEDVPECFPELDCEISLKDLITDIAMSDIKIDSVISDKIQQMKDANGESDNFTRLLSQLYSYYRKLTEAGDIFSKFCLCLDNFQPLNTRFQQMTLCNGNSSPKWTEMVKNEVSELQKVKKDMEGQMVSIEKRCRDLERMNENLEEAHKGEIKNFKDELEKFAASLKSSSKEINALKNLNKKLEKKLKQEENKIVTLESERIEFEDKMKQMKKELEQTKKKINEEKMKAKKEKERDAEIHHRDKAEIAEKENEILKERKEKQSLEDRLREAGNRYAKLDKERKLQNVNLTARARTAEVAYLETKLTNVLGSFDSAKEHCRVALEEIQENLKKAHTQSDADAVRRNFSQWKSYEEDLQKMVASIKGEFDAMIEGVSKGQKNFSNFADLKIPVIPELPRVVRVPPVQVVQPSTPLIQTPTITVPPAGVIGQSRTPQTPRNRTSGRNDHYSPCLSSTSTASPPTSPSKGTSLFIPTVEASANTSPWSWIDPVGNVQEAIRSTVPDPRPYDLWASPLDPMQASSSGRVSTNNSSTWSNHDQQDWRTIAAHQQQAYRSSAPGMHPFFES